MAQLTEPTASTPTLDTLAERNARAAERLSPVRSSPGYWRRAWRRYRRDKVAMVALVLSIGVILFAVGAPLVSEFTGFTYRENHLDQKLKPPMTDGYILGSDGNGRDILTRLAYGGRTSLMFAGLAAISTLLVGSAVGSAAGFFGGWVDNVLMRLVDILLSIPTLVLLIMIASFYRPNVFVLAIAVALVSWAGVARLVRSEVLSLRTRDFVDAARVLGARNSEIIRRHIMPNVIPIIVVWLSLSVPGLILTEATLSYLGIGVQVPTPSWGNMLQEAKSLFRQQWTTVFIPGFMIFFTALCLNLVGNGLRDALDPRLNQ
jgi:peptide/nickel transport system permease protein